MTEVLPFPFANLQDLKNRWRRFPIGKDDNDTARIAADAELRLEDASQFILDVAPSAAAVHERTRRRVVCAVVKRAMEAEAHDMGGLKSVQIGTGPFQDTYQPTNPDGDYYLTKQEQKALRVGRQVAFTVRMGGDDEADS